MDNDLNIGLDRKYNFVTLTYVKFCHYFKQIWKSRSFVLFTYVICLQILGFFLGIVHFIDATLAFVEHRKFKIQIIQGNVVNGRGGVV